MSGSESPRAQCQGGSVGATLWAECKRSVRKVIQHVGKKKNLAINLCLIFQIIYAANLKYKLSNVGLS